MLGLVAKAGQGAFSAPDMLGRRPSAARSNSSGEVTVAQPREKEVRHTRSPTSAAALRKKAKAAPLTFASTAH